MLRFPRRTESSKLHHVPECAYVIAAVSHPVVRYGKATVRGGKGCLTFLPNVRVKRTAITNVKAKLTPGASLQGRAVCSDEIKFVSIDLVPLDSMLLQLMGKVCMFFEKLSAGGNAFVVEALPERKYRIESSYPFELSQHARIISVTAKRTQCIVIRLVKEHRKRAAQSHRDGARQSDER